MNKLQELLTKYGKKVEDLKFEYKGMSDKELETAFKKAFDDPDPGADPNPAEPTGDTPGTDTPGGNDSSGTEEDEEDTTDQDAADAVTATIGALPETPDANDQVAVQAARDAYDKLTDDQKELVDSEVVSALEAAEEAVAADKVAVAQRDAKDETLKRQNNELKYSVVVNGEIKEFAVSLIEKLNALRDLVNTTYSESDDCWYDVDAYDEDKYVIMHDYWKNKHYRQDYAVRNNVYSLKGDRVEVFAQYLTQDEINSLNSMKKNYEQISKDLMQYQKKELVASKDYSAISDKEEFIQIVDDVNNGKNEMTFEELKSNLDGKLLAYAKSGNLNFEAIERKEDEAKKNTVKKRYAKIGLMPSGVKGNPKKPRYGNIFKS